MTSEIRTTEDRQKQLNALYELAQYEDWGGKSNTEKVFQFLNIPYKIARSCIYGARVYALQLEEREIQSIQADVGIKREPGILYHQWEVKELIHAYAKKQGLASPSSASAPTPQQQPLLHTFLDWEIVGKEAATDSVEAQPATEQAAYHLVESEPEEKEVSYLTEWPEDLLQNPKSK